MRFTRLQLTGFKSFVDPTDLPIEPGLTGIVGPNGCGKSNLLEALRWVMGENRPTAMRGEGMEDVIFAGSGGRGARHSAEVVLHLDPDGQVLLAGHPASDSVEILRRITREGGSAYRMNGREMRARDVQMMFADNATGAHSPALVRQGQVAELVSARPRARRRVLEDAAGIGGLHARRHEAELRLSATETNLARVDDLVEALAAQVASLARQARQAERYREIGAALRRTEALLLWRRWAQAAADATEAMREADAALRAAAAAERAAQEATRLRETAEAALPPLREEDAIAAAVCQRLDIANAALLAEETRAREALAGLEARVAQIEQDRARETALAEDAKGSLSRLSDEAARLRAALTGQDDRQAEADAAAEAAAQALAAAEAELAERMTAAASVAARHEAAERASRTTAAALQAAREAAGRARACAETAEAALAAASQAEAAAAEAQGQAAAAAEQGEAALNQAEAGRHTAAEAEGEAAAARREAESAARAIGAEIAALERMMAGSGTADTGLLDGLAVAPGWEAALGAAFGDDLLSGLADGDGPAARPGWRPLPRIMAPPLPEAAAPLAPHVSAPPSLAPALSRALALIGTVPDRATGLRLQPDLCPGQSLVTPAGDLLRWDGFLRPAGTARSETAAALERRNRLSALRVDLAQAEAVQAGAVTAHEAARSALATSDRTLAEARDRRRAADQALATASRDLSRAEAARTNAEAARARAEAEMTQRQTALSAAAQAAAEAEQAARDLPPLAGEQAAADAARASAHRAREGRMAAAARLDTVRREGQGRRRRLEEIAAEERRWSDRMASARGRMAEFDSRTEAARQELATARAQPSEAAEKRARLAEERGNATRRLNAARDALQAAEAAVRKAAEEERARERDAGAARAARAAAEARAEAAETARTTAETALREGTDAAPDRLLGSLGTSADAVDSATALETEIARLRRARDALGAVNLRAADDMAEAAAERDRLLEEKGDLQAAVLKLRAGIAALNREGRERLLSAFEQVNDHFAALFTHLFSGGTARLALVESDDPLEAGLEILAQPPGKKLSTLTLLSGGEQTLTALALIFAVFLSNPAPICVLDEVDAPLDDSNVARFCNLLDEMCRRTETRFLIISHNPITMARMDRLFGVTMVEQGVSQLVSVDLGRATALVA